MKITHTLIGMGSAALGAAVPYLQLTNEALKQKKPPAGQSINPPSGQSINPRASQSINSLASL